MLPYYTEPNIEIYLGDMLAVLPKMAPARFSRVITDPPYHLTADKKGGTGPASLNLNSPAGRSRVTTGFMGKAWDGGDIAFRPDTWREVMRVCKPGSFLLAFGGTRTWHRIACAIEDAGWEYRDTIMYLYGTGFPKSLNIELAGAKTPGFDAAAWAGYGTSLKPAYEPIIVAMKPLDGTFVENAARHGVAGLNIDASRIAGAKPDTTRGAGGQNGRFSEIGAQGRVLDDGKGRWPANIVLDEAAAEMLDEQSGELSSGANPTRRSAAKFGGIFARFTGREECDPARGADAGGASRFFYTAKPSKSDRGLDNDHSTVKPTSLMKWLLTLTAPPDLAGDETLDPFGGSMTTVVAARELGHKIAAIDLHEEHCKIGVGRLAQQNLF